ncbi:IclR family transcriptional regulator [Rhodovulum sulfidophilum]|uniref:HTH-type transcriptional regulator BhcR n=1 Tax=Rhodovulum sulfidophilum TaxID=35806 RepID=UPI00192397AA|nr:HTH-type transcriptional regulator BhcR [Rhodovulum sulfidophilum]MBL3574741.1 IclR family transcriptional regulator [Rhodovulum sulfidophilum]MCE8431844.1 IclR family transcriptional regulator [Rhodovulum sulfidophilum]MCF4115449.1 IclR family transcriptional regulator [Rhodovulum sulfidophilum]
MTQPRPRGRPRAFHDKTDQNTVRALDRAMRLLTALSETKGLTLSELAALSNQSPATVYRVLITLQGHDIVELEEEAQRWHVGPGAFRIGSGFLRRTNVAERSRGAMQALMRATGETANLGVEDRDEVLFLTQVETHETIRAFFSPGTRGPMHCSGIGKALLAFLPAARVAAILETQGLPGFTPRSITSETGLHADLDRTRARGYAIDDQERAEGMRCIAAPIFNAHGEPVAGLSVSGPAFRIPLDAADGIGAEVRAAADRVTASTGGISPTEKSA